MTENGFSRYYLLHGKAVCKECYDKLIEFVFEDLRRIYEYQRKRLMELPPPDAFDADEIIPASIKRKR